jgi:hypothetical protein
MTTRVSARLGPACGVFFSIPLLVLPQHHLRPLHLLAFVLFLPFLAYLCSLLREAEGPGGWLSATALGAGAAGVAIKLVSVVPEIATRNLADGTPLHKALDHMASAATVISLYPLAISLAAIATVALGTGVLPRWLGLGAAITAIALAINGGFIHAENMPGLLLFVLWTLIASISLLRRALHQTARAGRASLAAS